MLDVLAWQRARAWQHDLARVAVHAVDSEFIVQVGAGGEAAAADVADDLALLHARAVAEALAEARHVAVQRLVRRAVLQHDRAAVAAFPADEGDAAVAGRLDRRADGRGIVRAEVRAEAVEHRVEARAAEIRADAEHVDRRAQEGL